MQWQNKLHSKTLHIYGHAHAWAIHNVTLGEFGRRLGFAPAAPLTSLAGYAGPSPSFADPAFITNGHFHNGCPR
jgi:hypothetical protein